MKIILLTFILFLFNTANAATINLEKTCNTIDDFSLRKFQGHDVDEVFRELKKAIPQKSEFESQTEYIIRVEKTLQSLPLAISKGSLCVVEKKFFEDAGAIYDPENKILWVKIFLNHTNNWFDGEKNYHQDFSIFFSERSRKDSSYIGSNAFGVSVQVSKIARSATFVSFDGEKTTKALKKLGATVRSSYLSYPIPMSPDEAKILHKNIKVAYHYKIRFPALANYEKIELPKLDFPHEINEKQSLVAGDLLLISIFNYRTGEMLKSVPLN